MREIQRPYHNIWMFKESKPKSPPSYSDNLGGNDRDVDNAGKLGRDLADLLDVEGGVHNIESHIREAGVEGDLQTDLGGARGDNVSGNRRRVGQERVEDVQQVNRARREEGNARGALKVEVGLQLEQTLKTEASHGLEVKVGAVEGFVRSADAREVVDPGRWYPEEVGLAHHERGHVLVRRVDKSGETVVVQSLVFIYVVRVYGLRRRC